MRLSIITVNLNNCEGLRKTIESVVNQTWKDFEFIIIDGGSTDGSVEVIKEYASQINYWVSEPDAGIYSAMNKGIGKANGEWLFFLGSGDTIYSSNTLGHVAEELPKIFSLFCGTVETKLRKQIIQPCKHNFDILEHNLQQQAVFYRYKLFKEFGRFDEHFKIIADWNFHIALLLKEKERVYFSDTVISCFDETGISSTLSTPDGISDLSHLFANSRYLCNHLPHPLLYRLIQAQYKCYGILGLFIKMHEASYSEHILGFFDYVYRFSKSKFSRSI